MDIVIGDTGGRDAVRSWLRAGPEVTDDELQARWDAAVEATADWIADAAKDSPPRAVVDFVVAVAADTWRAIESGGQLQQLPDGSISGATVNSSIIRRNAVLGGRWVRTPRTIA